MRGSGQCRAGWSGIGVALVFLTASACGPADDGRLPPAKTEGFTARELSLIRRLSPLPAPPADPTNRFADDPRAVRFGHYLFYWSGLSRDGKTNCATCHDPRQDWTRPERFPAGLEPTRRHSPTLWNVAYQRWQYWDGRKDTLWAQALEPIEAEEEMGSSRREVLRRVRGDAAVRRAYENLFGVLPSLPRRAAGDDDGDIELDSDDPVDRFFVNVGKAIAAFERTIVSDDSPFDRFAAALSSGGNDSKDATAITEYPAAARRGLRLFLGRGQCILCHDGPNFSDHEFHNIGLDRGDRPLDIGRYIGVPLVLADPFNGLNTFSDDREHRIHDRLRYVVQKDNNLGEFKTPTLRNVARTAPYMHDGRFATLREVLDFYSKLDQRPAIGHREETLVPLRLTDAETDDLIAFLESLNGPPTSEVMANSPSRPEAK